MNEEQNEPQNEPQAWLVEVRGTGEYGFRETGWEVYAVYLSRASAERWMRLVGNGLAYRITPLVRSPNSDPETRRTMKPLVGQFQKNPES